METRTCMMSIYMLSKLVFVQKSRRGAEGAFHRSVIGIEEVLRNGGPASVAHFPLFARFAWAPFIIIGFRIFLQPGL